MSSTLNDINGSQPIYYHREYKNDISQKPSEKSCQSSWIDQSQRVALAALPFFSLYKPIGFHLSLVMGGLRTLTCGAQLIECVKIGKIEEISYAMLQSTIAVAALAGTIFAHPVGMVISTGHDLTIEIVSLVGYLQKGEHQKVLEGCANIINNALYLALSTGGGLEVAIASFAMQIMLGLYHSRSEFQKDNYLEAAAHLLMAMIRGNQMAGQVQLLQTQWKIETLLEEVRQAECKKAASDKLHPNPESQAPWLSENAQSVVKARSLNIVGTVLSGDFLNEVNNGNQGVNQELIGILIKYGNNPDGIPVLHYAIKQNDEKAVDVLIGHGASPFTRDHQNRNCLYFAVESGNIHLVEKFITLQVSPNEAYNGWDTAFFHAIQTQKNEIAKYIYDHGGKIYSQPANSSAWEVCFSFGNYDMCKFLVERGAEIRYEGHPNEGYFRFNRDTSRLLLSSTDQSQSTRLQKIECLKYLTDKKLVTLPRNADFYSQTIMTATYPEALEYLLDTQYCSPNDRSTSGYPIIFYAAHNRDFGLALSEMLIQRGADVKAKASDQTLLYLLAPTSTLNASERARMQDVFSLLIKSGADLNNLLKRVGDDDFRKWLIAQGAR